MEWLLYRKGEHTVVGMPTRKQGKKGCVELDSPFLVEVKRA